MRLAKKAINYFVGCQVGKTLAALSVSVATDLVTTDVLHGLFDSVIHSCLNRQDSAPSLLRKQSIQMPTLLFAVSTFSASASVYSNGS